jgi:hypothetical protein|eukprot:TRINITY_DN74966_c0_g1_i1.p1 TRINITY_DN74966_c0_g1~~TRINITY_DN74966_c0_g1_i1.p1  ORF type:complete len:291 (-),score=45.56 TRINITY_DN74966_c0_g1_i1:116-988(-)
MGGNCTLCGGNERKPSNAFAEPTVAPGGSGPGLAEKVFDYRPKGGDADLFDKACAADDIDGIAGLLGSEQHIDAFGEKVHPWADDPKTIGTLAGMKLAMLASKATDSDEDIKLRIRATGVFPQLAEYLSSPQLDRVQAAVVALSFLTTECTENARAVHEAGALKPLAKCLDSRITGMRVAAGTTLRNLGAVSDEFRRDVVEAGALEGIVRQLCAEPGPGLRLSDVQLEVLLNLQDLIEIGDCNVIEEYALAAVRAGAIEKLEKLCEVAEDDVRGTAKDLLDTLANAQRQR